MMCETVEKKTLELLKRGLEGGVKKGFLSEQELPRTGQKDSFSQRG